MSFLSSLFQSQQQPQPQQTNAGIQATMPSTTVAPKTTMLTTDPVQNLTTSPVQRSVTAVPPATATTQVTQPPAPINPPPSNTGVLTTDPVQRTTATQGAPAPTNTTTTPAPVTPPPATGPDMTQAQSPTLSAQDVYNMYSAYNGGSGGYDVNNQQQMQALGAGTTYISQLQNILSTPSAQNDSNPAYTWLTQNGYLTPASSSQSGNVELGPQGQAWMGVANQAGTLSQGNPWGATPYQGAGSGFDVIDRSQMTSNPNYGNLATPQNTSYTMNSGFGNTIAKYGPGLAGAGLAALGMPTWALGGINAVNGVSNGAPIGQTLANVGLSVAGSFLPQAVNTAANLGAGAYNLIRNPNSAPTVAGSTLLARGPGLFLDGGG